MPDAYAATGSNTVTATPGDTCLGLNGISGRRGWIYEIWFTHAGTPADNVVQWQVRRHSAVGTHSDVVPTLLTDGAPAADCIADENHTVEPTITSATEAIDMDLNERASLRWVAVPGGELVVPATANNGYAATPISATYSGDARVTMHWTE